MGGARAGRTAALQGGEHAARREGGAGRGRGRALTGRGRAGGPPAAGYNDPYQNYYAKQY